MASILSILKTILNVKLFHSESQEVVTETVHKYGEDHVQQKILIHCRPIRREQGRCPVCGRKCGSIVLRVGNFCEEKAKISEKKH